MLEDKISHLYYGEVLNTDKTVYLKRVVQSLCDTDIVDTFVLWNVVDKTKVDVLVITEDLQIVVETFKDNANGMDVDADVGDFIICVKV